MNAKGCCKVHGARVISKNSDKKILQKQMKAVIQSGKNRITEQLYKYLQWNI